MKISFWSITFRALFGAGEEGEAGCCHVELSAHDILQKLPQDRQTVSGRAFGTFYAQYLMPTK